MTDIIMKKHLTTLFASLFFAGFCFAEQNLKQHDAISHCGGCGSGEEHEEKKEETEKEEVKEEKKEE